MQDIDISDILGNFYRLLINEGKSSNTVNKYLRDVRQFLEYAQQSEATGFDPELLWGYRKYLGAHYLASSANSKISAVNYFLKSQNHPGGGIRVFRVQKTGFRSDERSLTKEEYLRLLRQAQAEHKPQLCLAMQTIAATGIRISELQFVTVNALEKQEMVIYLKGKVRKVLLPEKLCRVLAAYALNAQIIDGPIFVTQSGRPIDRSNLLHSMKRLCSKARVSSHKVFPHNLRHLFAVTYYENQKDVCHLADILGHSDVNTTRIYTSMSSNNYRQKIEELDLLLEE